MNNNDTLIVKYYKFEKSAGDLVFDIHNGGIDLEFSLDAFINTPQAMFLLDENKRCGRCDFVLKENSLELDIKNSPVRLSMPTSYAINPPPGLHMLVVGRSGNYFNRNFDVFKGLIDSSYRGRVIVGVVIDPLEPTKIEFVDKMRIGQLVFLNYIGKDLSKIILKPVDKYDELDVTYRGSKGFGSTGI